MKIPTHLVHRFPLLVLLRNVPLLFAFILPAIGFGQTAPGNPAAAVEWIPGQYIVMYKDGALASNRDLKRLTYAERQATMKVEAAATLQRNGIPPEKLGHVYGTVLQGFSVTGLTEAEAGRLRRASQVQFIEQDQVVRLGNMESLNGSPVEILSQTTPWGVTRVGGGLPGIGKRAWVLDTGIDLDHPDLNVNTALSAYFIETSPEDGHGHGTHVAGTIAAMDNGIGVIGVAAGAEVVAVKVLAGINGGSIASIVAGVNYVAAHADSNDVANMSLAGAISPISSILDTAITTASGVCKFVLAAGNNALPANIFFPASLNGPNIFTISAMDSTDTWASFSNFGNPPVDYCAPGVAVLSCWNDGDYHYLQGTSMATPHVSGLLLLGAITSPDTVIGDPDGNPDPIAILDLTADADGDGVTIAGGDCDDLNSAVYPGAPEVCDLLDNNCDGVVDEGFTHVTCYLDSDGDGFGNPSESKDFCTTCGPGYVLDNTDCNDNSAGSYPGATEICDLLDNDCDGLIDEGFDMDGDGYATCAGDCDDNNPAVNPGAPEICNGIDDDCNGEVDDFPVQVVYPATNVPVTDTVSPVVATLELSGISGNITDLDVLNIELFNSLMQDVVMELTSPQGTTVVLVQNPPCGIYLRANYDDESNNGYYSIPCPISLNDTLQAFQPLAAFDGENPNGTWTLTLNNVLSGSGAEIINWSLGISTPATIFYADTDGDGFGDPNISSMASCKPPGYVVNNFDCDDNNAAINPGATEICNGIDDDCDGQVEGPNICCPAGNAIFVNINANGANDGSSWADAYTALQDALDGTCPGITEIWVAAGTYFPTKDRAGTPATGDPRNKTFFMNSDLKIFGGFNGTETMLSQRDWAANVTTLSGDLGIPGNNSDNAYHVVSMEGLPATALLDGFSITGGKAEGSTPPSGGGILINASSSNLSTAPGIANCHFFNNSAFNGGAVYNDAFGDVTVSPVLTNCTFTGNTATGFGGAIANSTFNGTASPVLTDCVFTGNSAVLRGGAVYNYSRFPAGPTSASNPVLTNCVFTNNSAENGGAVYNLSDNSGTTSPVLTDCTFTGNTATNLGGAIYNWAVSATVSPVLTGCVFTNNSATVQGGAIYNRGQDVNGDSSPEITNCSFSNNTSTFGGSMLNAGFAGGTANPVLEGCTFSENQASDAGGAVYNFAGTGTVSPVWTNCIFMYNWAASAGGAMFSIATNGNTSNSVLTNCLFANNEAAFGGAMLNNGVAGTCSPVLTNCSFADNEASNTGGAIYNWSSANGAASPVVTNGIFWGNVGGGGSIFNASASPQVSYTLMEDAACPPGATCGAGMIFDEDPLFMDAFNDDYTLQSCSPSINAGNTAAVPPGIITDLGGDPRFYQNGPVDMGAYEYQGLAATWFADADGDTYGNPAVSQTGCTQPVGFVADNTDCNDTNPDINPGAPEICNGLDDDCSGSPEAATTTWTGNGDGANWSNPANWSDGIVPLPCQDVVVPSGTVTVPAGFHAVGKTLDVATGAVLEAEPTGTMDIEN